VAAVGLAIAPKTQEGTMLGGIMGFTDVARGFDFRHDLKSPSHFAMEIDLKGIGEGVDAYAHYEYTDPIGTSHEQILTDYYLI
jgi:hypothetical protein